VAAGVLLVKEAGGKITDFVGKPWSLKRINMKTGETGNRDIVASNGLVHKDIINLIS
jgi:fructose-1,6-bisphosphatase/inositol monophosphatase family enzyme